MLDEILAVLATLSTTVAAAVAIIQTANPTKLAAIKAGVESANQALADAIASTQP